MTPRQETGPRGTSVAETKTGAVKTITDTINELLLRQPLRGCRTYESLVRVPRTGHSYENMPHVVVAKQSSRESCVNDVIR